MILPRFSQTEQPHRRYNPLTGEWVLVSPHRAKRPWQGQDEEPSPNDLPEYDPDCYLCPGNRRVSGDVNPGYETTYVFPNDYPVLHPTAEAIEDSHSPLFHATAATGTSRVICFSPDHSKTLPELPVSAIRSLIDTLDAELEDLGKSFLWVQAFENKGAMMGCSQPHPHGQIWACDYLPNEIQKEDNNLAAYFREHGQSLLLDYALAEAASGERTVIENAHWIVVVPFWAVWPFEVLLLPKTTIRRFSELNHQQRDELAVVIKDLTTRYDNLFRCSFPYSMGWHFAPFFDDDRGFDHWQLHAHFYPPLLRSSTVRKFMVGFEMLAEVQRDLTPEQAATKLREVSAIHYRESPA